MIAKVMNHPKPLTVSQHKGTQRDLGERRYEESLALCQLSSFMVNGTIHRKY